MPDPSTNVAATGVPGLDTALGGGLPRDRIYLVEGESGSGKTTLALQFLLEGAREGESGLYVTLSETRDELVGIATSHGWKLDGVTIHELPAPAELAAAETTIFPPSELELVEAVRDIISCVERIRPSRIVFDSLTDIRLLAQGPLRFRRQLLALKQYFSKERATVLLLEETGLASGDSQLRSLAHGVLQLDQRFAEIGAERRRLRVLKLRGRSYPGGYHNFVIRRGGMQVFPRLVSKDHTQRFEAGVLQAGVADLDHLAGGGLDRGTSTLVIGPAGSGKSILAAQYAASAAARGEHVAFFAFDEGTGTLLARATALEMGFAEAVESGNIRLQKLDPAEMSPGEFNALVQRSVEHGGARVVVIDSLNGYLNAMPEERLLTPQLHELLAYLGHRGVATILVLAQHGLLGAVSDNTVDVSYLADTVILVRFFEFAGHVRRAISVVKRRGGAHETTIREYIVQRGGLRLGAPLDGFRGVLTGTPEFVGTPDTLLEAPSSGRA